MNRKPLTQDEINAIAPKVREPQHTQAHYNRLPADEKALIDQINELRDEIVALGFDDATLHGIMQAARVLWRAGEFTKEWSEATVAALVSRRAEVSALVDMGVTEDY